jgi:hypothetical protein
MQPFLERPFSERPISECNCQKYASFSIGYYTRVFHPDQQGLENFFVYYCVVSFKRAFLVLEKLKFMIKGNTIFSLKKYAAVGIKRSVFLS